MKFMQSKTVVNLARAYTGETQAFTRYEYYAQLADSENFQYIAKIFRQIIINEQAHAKVFFDHIYTHVPDIAGNIEITAGYPYAYASKTADNLKFAMDAELNESNNVYPAFAKAATDELYPDISNSFNLIAKIEAAHANTFKALLDKLNSGNLYSSSFPTVWKCSVCGHVFTSDAPWQKCPVCKSGTGYVEIVI